jgi:transposase
MCWAPWTRGPRHQLRDLIVTAPEQVRQQLAGLARRRQVEVAARFRPQDLAGPGEGVRAVMASVAQRHQALAAEIARPGTALEELLTHAPAEFLAKQGVATQVAATLLATTGDNPGRVRTEASFAALCGASRCGRHATSTALRCKAGRRVDPPCPAVACA